MPAVEGSRDPCQLGAGNDPLMRDGVELGLARPASDLIGQMEYTLQTDSPRSVRSVADRPVRATRSPQGRRECRSRSVESA